MSKRQEQFFAEVYAGARQAGMSDARARVAAAQASLETGYGKSMPGGNMFGIKAGKSWKGPTQNVNTWEDVGGRVNIVDKFRAYTNPFDSLSDWAGLTDRRFPEVSAATSFAEGVDGLRAGQPGGYATDRKYSSKLKSIDEKFGQAAQQNYGTMGRDMPVPSAAPRGVMDALGSSPDEVASFTDRGLRSASFPATPTPVERGGLLSEPSTFDNERFGPAPSTMGFDTARFGDVNPSPTQSYGSMVEAARASRRQPANVAAFDSGRLGTATTNIPVSDLRQGLLSANAQMAAPQGLLSAAQAATMPTQARGPASFQGPVAPGMQPAMDAANLGLDVMEQRAAMGLPAVNQPAVQPGYVDPGVSVGAPAAPARAVQPSQAAMGGGLLSMDGALTGGFGPALTKEDADRMKRSLQMRTLGGGVLGGLLGGLALGPVGGLLGGYAGRQMGAKSYFPDAPKKAGNSDNKGYGRDSLSSEGRDAAGRSKQFDRAVSSGKGGLWRRNDNGKELCSRLGHNGGEQYRRWRD